jgi:hypothetical protein
LVRGDSAGRATHDQKRPPHAYYTNLAGGFEIDKESPPRLCPDHLGGDSDPGERVRVGEGASKRRAVRSEGADLEVGLPSRNGRLDAVRGAEAEAEAVVVGGTAEQGDEGLGEGVGGAEDGVHEGAADTTGVVIGMDAERAET